MIRFHLRCWLIAASVLSMIAMSCAGSTARVIRDRETGETGYVLSPIEPDVSPDYIGLFGRVMFAIHMYTAEAPSDTTLLFKVVIMSTKSDWQLDEGDMLAFSLDRDRVELSCIRVDDLGADRVKELGSRGEEFHFIITTNAGWYPIDSGFLRRLARAEVVDFTIEAAKSYIQGRLTDKNLSEIRKFQKKHLP